MKDKGGDRTRSHLTSPPHLPLLCPYYGSDTEHEEEEHLQWWHNVRKVFFFAPLKIIQSSNFFRAFSSLVVLSTTRPVFTDPLCSNSSRESPSQ